MTGERIKRIRSSQDLSQTQVGELMACDRSLISNIETGKRSLRLNELGLIAKAFDSDLELFALMLLFDINELQAMAIARYLGQCRHGK